MVAQKPAAASEVLQRRFAKAQTTTSWPVSHVFNTQHLNNSNARYRHVAPLTPAANKIDPHVHRVNVKCVRRAKCVFVI